MIHPVRGNGGDDARDGRGERVAVQPCRLGGSYPRAGKIRQVMNAALARLAAEFEGLRTDFGRPSIVPERSIQILFPHGSERQLMKQMQYDR